MRLNHLPPNADPDKIAAIALWFTGADIANLINKAAIFATRRGGKTVTIKDFTATVERIVVVSEKKSRLLIPAEREHVAYHEMGHISVTHHRQTRSVDNACS